MTDSLAGHVALVTGGSRGIGRASCLALAASGAAVTVNYRRDDDAAQEVVLTIESDGGEATAIRADVSDREAVEDMFARVHKRFGAVDILVNNAGIWLRGDLLDHRDEDFDAMWKTNVKGVVHCAAAAAPGMIEKGWGRIINVSSNAGIGTALPGTTFYAATKAAVLNLTRRMALELGKEGVTVNAVLPGYTRTDMTTAERTDAEVARVFETMNQRSVLGRGVAEPEEIAHVINFLASERSGFVTGQFLMADGGRIDYLSHA